MTRPPVNTVSPKSMIRYFFIFFGVFIAITIGFVVVQALLKWVGMKVPILFIAILPIIIFVSLALPIYAAMFTACLFLKWEGGVPKSPDRDFLATYCFVIYLAVFIIATIISYSTLPPETKMLLPYMIKSSQFIVTAIGFLLAMVIYFYILFEGLVWSFGKYSRDSAAQMEASR